MPKQPIIPLFSFLILMICTISDLQAQDATLVSPGSGHIDGSFIEPYTNLWQVTEIDSAGNRTVLRNWSDYAQILQRDGIDYLHRVQDLYTPSGELEQTWINVVRLDDLSPVRFSVYGANGTVNTLEFSGRSVTQRSNLEGGEFKTESFEGGVPMYDWNLYGMLLVGLPEEAGAQYRIPFWSQVSASTDTLVVTSAGPEAVTTLKGNTWQTFRMETDRGMTFWVTKEAPYVIQLEVRRPGAPTMIWEMTQR